MKPTVAFLEPFAGSAALTYDLFGTRRPCAYMGSKLLYAPRLLHLMGLRSTPQRKTADDTHWLVYSYLSDPGEWGHTHQVLASQFGAELVAKQLRLWCESILARHDGDLAAVAADNDDRALFDHLRNTPVGCFNSASRAAAHLYLQSRTSRGKPVGPRPDDRGWVTHGFDPEHDPRQGSGPNSNARGWATPRWKLAKRVDDIARAAEKHGALGKPAERVGRAVEQKDASSDHVAAICNALALAPVNADRVVVYVDPPYPGTTGYGEHDPDADQLRAFLLNLHALAPRAEVYVSGFVRLPGLPPSWTTYSVESNGPRRWRESAGSRRELVTVSPGAFVAGGAA